MSVILKLNLFAADSSLITSAAAVAVCRALKSMTDKNPQIKWVNDIILGDRKICGILTEAVLDFESGAVSCIIIGIGLNFTTKTEQFGPLKDIAGSLFPTGQSGISRNRLAAEIINNLLQLSENISNRNFMKEYRSLSCVLGRDIEYYENNVRYCGKAVDIDENGRLIVKVNGRKHILTYGDLYGVRRR